LKALRRPLKGLSF
jgi:hypothetical protein